MVQRFSINYITARLIRGLILDYTTARNQTKRSNRLKSCCSNHMAVNAHFLASQGVFESHPYWINWNLLSLELRVSQLMATHIKETREAYQA